LAERLKASAEKESQAVFKCLLAAELGDFIDFAAFKKAPTEQKNTGCMTMVPTDNLRDRQPANIRLTCTTHTCPARRSTESGH